MSCLLWASACGRMNPNVPPSESEVLQQLRVRYHLGPCYGRCEVYSIELYDGGRMIFKGERFTEKPGAWVRSIDERRAEQFIELVEAVNISALPRQFPSMLSDLSTTTITYFSPEGDSVRTSFREQSTPQLEQLAERFRNWAAEDDWQKLKMPGKVKKMGIADAERQEIIVQLSKGADAGGWVKDYAKQGVTLKERVAQGSDYYVILADPNLMDAEELLTYLLQDKHVIQAQLNRSVDER